MVKSKKLLAGLRILVIAIVLFMGAAGITSQAHAASAAAIGVVDFQMLMAQHPDTALAEETMKNDTDQAQKDFDEKTQSMPTDEEKKAYYNQVQQGLDDKKQMLFGSIQAKVIAAVKEVADAKGLAVVVDKGTTIYGGQDITSEVGKRFTANK